MTRKLTTAEKMSKARTAMLLREPFFGMLALRLNTRPDPTQATAWTDGRTLGYNEEFIDKLSLDETKGLIAHEVMHVANCHHTRRKERDPAKWNIACDIVINGMLRDAGFVLPKGGVFEPTLEKLSVDEVYNRLPDFPKMMQLCSGGGEPGEGTPDPAGTGAVRDMPGEGKDPATGKPNEPSPGQVAAEEAEVKSDMRAAAIYAKQQGKLPAGLERMIDDLMKPVILWKDVLRRFMTEKSNDDFTWSRPQRRFIASGLYLPTRQSEGSGEIVVCIDTSGSVGEKELNEFGAEIRGIIDEARPKKTHVIYCDAAVNRVDTFEPNDDVFLVGVGGGGTSFIPPFEYVRENQIDCKCLVYLTDGYGAFPDEAEVPFPTMWVINNNAVEPPWGEHLILEVE